MSRRPGVCFDAMFAHMDDSLGLCVYHVHAPGHFNGTKNKAYKYPSIKEMADQVQEALNEMKTGPVIFVGVGAGARILTRDCDRDTRFSAWSRINITNIS